MKRLKLLCTICFLITNQLTHAGSNSSEYVFMHVNRNVLLTGSELKYTAYVTNKTNNNVSNLIYFQIIDSDQTIVKSWKSETKENRVAGIFKIPDSWHSGTYTLFVFTHKTRNYNSENLCKTPLIIERIYEQLNDSININNIGSIDSIMDVNDNTYIEVNIDSKNKINIDLQAIKGVENADLSLSLTENNALLQYEKQYFSKYQIKPSLNTNEQLPSENGFYILSGCILTNDSTPVANELLYLSYTDTTVHFKYFTTIESGEFCFILDSSFYNKNLIIQLANYTNKVLWFINPKKLSDITSYENSTQKQLQNELYINNLKKRELVHRVYHQEKPKLKSEYKKGFTPNFFGTPSYIVKPSDYIELKDFQDICDNILPSVRLKKEDNQWRIGMVIDQDIIYENVLVCINGVPCANMNYIEKLNSGDIKQIEIYNKTIMHGELTFNGFLAIYTNSIEFNDQMLNSAHTEVKNTITSNIESVSNISKNEPNILPDSYWNSNINIKEGNNFNINIKKPEIGSNYTITINGLINKKIPFSYQKNIEF